jgi:Xaa-Pro aminopeptidase
MYECHALRRTRLLAQMQAAGGGIALIPTSLESLRNNDASYPYRHDSSFYYLTGFTEPEAALVLVAHEERLQSILFCREKIPEREIWDGFRHGPDGACSLFGFDQAFPIAALKTLLPDWLATAPSLFYAFGCARPDAIVHRWLDTTCQAVGSATRASPRSIDIAPLINEMRLIKDQSEIALMQSAADISAAAHRRAMRASKPGMFEYEIEAELLYEFRKNGAQAPAYTSIVAAGANGCVLHYDANNARCKDGDLVLIDAGCEFGSYASDISRTYPVNGRFSAPQRDLYELVLAAHQAALDAIAPGRPYLESHEKAVRVLAAGMLEFGLLDRNMSGELDDVIASQAYRQFYMHGTGHWLGLDVHDVGQYREPVLFGEKDPARPHRKLEAGMVLTVEPGIYVRPTPGVPEKYWNIGIRIEDEVLVTADGYHVLSHAAPKSIGEIEALMAQ